MFFCFFQCCNLLCFVYHLMNQTFNSFDLTNRLKMSIDEFVLQGNALIKIRATYKSHFEDINYIRYVVHAHLSIPILDDTYFNSVNKIITCIKIVHLKWINGFFCLRLSIFLCIPNQRKKKLVKSN